VRVDIFKEVKKLNFPAESYVIVGSGHLIALGLKEGRDIDIVVTEALFEKCKEEGWEEIKWTYPEKIGHIYLRKGIVELYLDVNCNNFKPTTKELIKRAKIINGVPFASLDDLLKLKREYVKKKPKHKKDIQLIEKHLETLL
jgi:hypothetical protein